MADKKISALTAASTPLAGSEVLPIVQSGSTVKVSIDNLTTGKTVSMNQINLDNSTVGFPTLGTASGSFRMLGNGGGLFGLFGGLDGGTGRAWLQAMRTDGATAYDLRLQPVGGNVRVGTGNVIVETAGKGIATSVTNGNVNLIPDGSGIVASDSGHSFNKIASRRVSKTVAKSGTAVLTVSAVTTTSTHLAVRIDINVAFTNSTNLQYHAGYLVLTCDQTTNGGGTAIAEYYNGTVGNFVVATTDFVVTRPGSGQLVVTYTNNNGADSNNIEFAVTGVFDAATIA